MSDQLLICTDLDRTLIPNGPEPESPGARAAFSALVARAEVHLAYVSGRDRELVEQAMTQYNLPQPNHVITDVGTTIYRVDSTGGWQRHQAWDNHIGGDWADHTAETLHPLLADVAGLRLQEASRQKRFKLSYFTAIDCNRENLATAIDDRLVRAGVESRLVWSIDEPAGQGLLDVLPAAASKYHAIEELLRSDGFDANCCLFCGDSGNDLEVLASPLRSVLVANSAADVQADAQRLVQAAGHADTLYIARGGFAGMNGCYSAGIVEGVAHFFPGLRRWLPPVG